MSLAVDLSSQRISASDEKSSELENFTDGSFAIIRAASLAASSAVLARATTSAAAAAMIVSSPVRSASARVASILVWAN